MPMNSYYCHECAIKLGMYHPAAPIAFSVTSCQLGKLMKHTIPLSSAGLVSVFTGSGSPLDTYEGYAVTTVNSGHVQFDEQGRMNIVWVASCQTGISYQGGM